MKCAVLQHEAKFHVHPLTPFWRWITFTCDICGKEGKVKVVRHRHLLHLTHSSLELRESDSRFCLLCVQKVDTRYGLYYCSKCDFVAHLNCAINEGNREDINLLELEDEENEDAELDQSVESAAAYKVKNIKVGEDGTEIATEIKHFSHEHDLKLTDEEVHNNEKCDGNTRFIDTHSPSKSHGYCVVLVVNQQMALSTFVNHAGGLNLMFNVVWSQKSLPTKVISTNSSSPTQALNRVAVAVVIEDIEYSAVLVVNLHLTLNVRHYHKP
ncbi:hypothetical protein CFP56_043521 [Quercus suber]|uniref:DC1 domain-containing protein n=1 Tax=Quercus suber TaxID=58331 RepID=A0AAW0LIV0_QUESU